MDAHAHMLLHQPYIALGTTSDSITPDTRWNCDSASSSTAAVLYPLTAPDLGRAMSTTSLPSYRPASSLNGAPTYSFEPREQERRLAMGGRRIAYTGGIFSKQSRNKNTSLHLTARGDSDTLPTYGAGSHLNGFVQVLKGDGITGVEVKLEGSLKLREIAAGGHATVRLCSSTRTLWKKERETHQMCPERLDFSLPFPESFLHDEVSYPLPPTYTVKLSGIPGFTADIEYNVNVLVSSEASGPALKNKALDLIAGTSNVTAPILYYPRSLPPSPLPSRLSTDAFGFITRNEWTCIESTISAKADLHDIKVKLYIPASRTFSMSEPIPFHLLLCSSAPSLAAFLPMSPALNTLGRPKAMRLQAMRQAAVDVKNVLSPNNRSAKREIWRIDSIGEATFTLIADAPSWIAYSGEIPLNESIKTPGFRAAGLAVKDCLLLTLNPPDLTKCPFGDLRQVVGVRLTTDGYGGPVGRPPVQS